MMHERLLAQTQALRESFDRRFAVPRSLEVEDSVSLLGLRLGGQPFALRLDTLAGLQSVRRLVPIPGSGGAMLGLTGVRGRLVPVFSLSALLELPPEPAANWLALLGRDEPVALAFAELEGHLEVPPALLQRALAERSPDSHSLLLPGETNRRLIDTAALLEALPGRAH